MANKFSHTHTLSSHAAFTWRRMQPSLMFQQDSGGCITIYPAGRTKEQRSFSGADTIQCTGLDAARLPQAPSLSTLLALNAKTSSKNAILLSLV